MPMPNTWHWREYIEYLDRLEAKGRLPKLDFQPSKPAADPVPSPRQLRDTANRPWSDEEG